MTTTPADTTDLVVRPLRADARRNRQKLLEAAHAVFAEHGREAQIDDIARRAKVGVGTVYRHFPTKDDLIRALMSDTFDRLAEEARRELASIEDPWEAFSRFLWMAGENISSDRALMEAMSAQAEMVPDDCPGQHALRDITGQLMRRAQQAGQLRPDAVVDDIPMLMCGVGTATMRKHESALSWRRHLAIVLDGLRAGAASSQLPD
jgi:AcrR family transcriptional regulator